MIARMTIYERVRNYHGERKFRVYASRDAAVRKRKRSRKEKWWRIAAHRGGLLTERIGESSNGKSNWRDHMAG